MRSDDSKPAKLLTTLKASTAPMTHEQMKDAIWGVGSATGDDLLHKTIERARRYGSDTRRGTIISTTHFRWDPSST
jgi:hypothetical protein